jgi:hypothetical protein
MIGRHLLAVSFPAMAAALLPRPVITIAGASNMDGRGERVAYWCLPGGGWAPIPPERIRYVDRDSILPPAIAGGL